MIKSILLVGTGGFLGSALRYLISYQLESKILSSFPYGTFAVNLIGSFILGMLIGSTIRDTITPEARLLLATGFCGGFTTFSTFSYEFFAMIQDGQFHLGLAYIMVSLIGGLIAIWAGILVTKLITS